MAQRMTSLLSLPDELLDHIFDFLAEPLQGPHPLVPVLSVCRRVYKIVKPILYRDVVLGKYLKATLHIEAAIQQNPLLGQLVRNLELRDYGSFHPAHERGVLSREVEATLHAFTKLTGLTVALVEPDEAASALAALPPTTLRSLDLQLIWSEEPSHWQDLQTRLSRFSGLRVLKCKDLDSQSAITDASFLPREPRLSAQHLSLPSLLELHMTDYVFLELVEGAGHLRQTLPRLQVLHITITRSEFAFAISACLLHLPSSLAKVAISLETFSAVERQWLSTFPVVHSLEISESVREPDLLAYLASATTLEIIKFTMYGGVTDRVLRALTRAGRPPRLRRIHLDHVECTPTEEIAKQLDRYKIADLRVADQIGRAQLRNYLRPYWQPDSSEEGLLSALATADANGIEVAGTAVDSLEWEETESLVRAFYMMRRARATDNYDEVVELYGEEMVTVWLKKHAPNTVRFALAGSGQD